MQGLFNTLIKHLDENKIILSTKQLESIGHLNIVKLVDSQLKIIDDHIEKNNELIELLEVCSIEDCSSEKNNKFIEAMED